MYGVDTFTAVNLLAFSRWAGQIKPKIPFTVTRWIYAVCIIISFALLIYRWLIAIRALRSKSIARNYLNSLAMRIQSIRPGGGWKRFLVFAELTKSKKGAEYVALFTYFSFECKSLSIGLSWMRLTTPLAWMNTVFADGPRQVVNAITLYSVMQMDLLPGGENAETSSDSPAGVQFFENIKILAVNNNLRAVVLICMLFTLVVWVLSVIKLLIAIALYLIFLFHHIPSRDGTLTAYCRRKINTRVMRIVTQKVNKALAKGVALRDRDPAGGNLGTNAKPTLPTFGDEDKEPMITPISRTTTQATLPQYTSRPGTAAPDQNLKLPDLWTEDKPALSRTATETSAFSESAATAYSPLDGQSSPAPPVPPLPILANPPPVHSNTPMSRPMNQSQFAPAPNGMGRSIPGPGYRNGYNNPYALPEASAGAAYRSYSPAPDPLARSMTPGVAVSSQPDMDYPNRTFSPAARTPTPKSAPGASSSPGHPVTGFPPASRSVPPGMAATHPQRTMTPVNYNTMGANAMGGIPPRVFSPGPRNGTPQLTNAAGYAAFDPSVASQNPIPSSPAYRPYGGQDAASPLNDYRRARSPGPGQSIQPASHQPMNDQPLRPYRNDGHF